jgi:protein-S-isoprenylcysteine O-methyltransferase Ste14
MAVVALLLYASWLVLTFGVRSILARRRGVDAGFRGISGRPGDAAWWGGVLFVVALIAGLVAPIATMAGLGPLPGLRPPAVHVAGLVLACLGVAATLWAQGGMGAAWRVGVDPSEHTNLVTTGPFWYVRNPVFTAMITAALGLALMTPNLVAGAAVAALVSAVQLQVRVVEEPYLHRIHGPAYLRYACVTGRFLPRVGRLHPVPTDATTG